MIRNWNRKLQNQSTTKIITTINLDTYMKLVEVVKNTNDEFGNKKYANVSHFVELSIKKHLAVCEGEDENNQSK